MALDSECDLSEPKSSKHSSLTSCFSTLQMQFINSKLSNDITKTIKIHKNFKSNDITNTMNTKEILHLSKTIKTHKNLKANEIYNIKTYKNHYNSFNINQYYNDSFPTDSSLYNPNQ